MGNLLCQRCGAFAVADSQEEADKLIDHALGQKIGRPCSGRKEDLVWEAGVIRPKPEPSIEEPSPEPEISSPKKTKKKSKRGT